MVSRENLSAHDLPIPFAMSTRAYLLSTTTRGFGGNERPRHWVVVCVHVCVCLVLKWCGGHSVGLGPRVDCSVGAAGISSHVLSPARIHNGTWMTFLMCRSSCKHARPVKWETRARGKQWRRRVANAWECHDVQLRGLALAGGTVHAPMDR